MEPTVAGEKFLGLKATLKGGIETTPLHSKQEGSSSPSGKETERKEGRKGDKKEGR